MSAFCSSCGAQIDTEARFCRACGTPVASPPEKDRAASVPPLAPSGTTPPPHAGGRRPPFGRIALVALLVLVVGIVGIALLATSGPADAVTKHLDALAKRDDAAAYALTSPAFRTATSATEFTSFVDANPLFRSGSYSVAETTVDGDAATVTVGLKSGSEARTADFQVVKVDGEWRLSGYRLRAAAATTPTSAPSASAAATAQTRASAAPTATAASGPRSMRVETTLDIPRPVSMLAVNTTTQRVFGAGDASMVAISGKDERVDTTSGTPSGMTPVSVAVNSAKDRIFYAYRTGSSWYIEMRGSMTGNITPATAEAQAMKVTAVAVHSASDRLFQLFDRRLWITKGELTGGTTQSLAAGGIAIAVNESTGEAYVLQSGGQIVVIGADGSLGKSFPAGLPVTHLAVDSASGLLYGIEPGSRSVVVIDPSSGSMAGVMTVPATPTDVEVSPSKKRVYVSTVEGVVAIDAATRTVYSRTSLSGTPAGLAIDPSSGIVYVAHSAANTVTLLRD
ncbi:MAG: DUF4864 domain-containing protein [Chloroflexota bacterium]|nr:DUF4864 domain-containing protein [Chloroflexota bacterium]